MEKNIRDAESALDIAGDAKVNGTTDQQQALAIVGIGQGIVALAKGVGAIAGVLYLAHIEKHRGATADTPDAGRDAVESLVRKGLGL